MKKIPTILIALMSVSILLGGCYTSDDDSQVDETYLEKLDEDKFYVRHANNNQCEEIYFGEATFEIDEIKTTPDSKRVMWFKDDFDKIPTLYKGDSLIYYTNDILQEIFYFERFEDLEYTVGLCNMSITDSGRYAISTDIKKKCTYPESDTDILLNFTNKYVVLDTLSGHSVREKADEDSPYSFLSRGGTINGLEKDKSYEMEIYEGTVKHDFIFKADIKPLCSMEVTQSTDFSFESEKVINIAIPYYFNTGYYMINGVGMIRYVNGSSYDESTDYNTKNNTPEEMKDKTSTVNDLDKFEDSTTENDGSLDMTNPNDGLISTFTVTESGSLSIHIKFTGTVQEGYPDVSAIVTSPSEKSNLDMNSQNGELDLTFTADETGTYKIIYYDLYSRIPEVSITTEFSN